MACTCSMSGRCWRASCSRRLGALRPSRCTRSRRWNGVGTSTYCPSCARSSRTPRRRTPYGARRRDAGHRARSQLLPGATHERDAHCTSALGRGSYVFREQHPALDSLGAAVDPSVQHGSLDALGQPSHARSALPDARSVLLGPPMKERPIPFTGESVRTILDGQKTQTRRVITLARRWEMGERADGGPWPYYPEYVTGEPECLDAACRYGQAGDRLWGRETGPR